MLLLNSYLVACQKGDILGMLKLTPPPPPLRPTSDLPKILSKNILEYSTD